MFDRLTNSVKSKALLRFFKKAFAQPAPFVYTYHPEPVTTGDYNRGVRWISGEYFDDHQILLAPHGNIWNCDANSLNMLRDFHGFQWMDDLAEVNTAQANRLIKFWLKEWLEKYRAGNGPGWDIETASWRLIRMITHATRILGDIDTLTNERYFHSLGLHIRYVSKYYEKEQTGLSRVLPLTAWLFAALSLENYHDDIRKVIDLLDEEADKMLTSNAVLLPSRNPEDLAEIFCLFVWADVAMSARNEDAAINHTDFIQIGGRSLRALRVRASHLLAAHGGGSGQSAMIERALSDAKVQGVEQNVPILGFVPVRAGQLTFVMDCDDAPMKSQRAQASTSGIWVNEGAHQIITNIGCTKNQNLQNRLLAQATQSQSTLCIDGANSSEFKLAKVPLETNWGGEITSPAKITHFDYQETNEATEIDCHHDGYFERFGFIHERKISIDRDGLFFAGVDILRSKDQAKTASVLKRSPQSSIPFEIQFHLGPKLEPHIDMNEQAVSFVSPSGNIWVMRQTGAAIELADTFIYDAKRITPIPTKVIILRSRLVDTSGYISWSFQAYQQ